MELTSDIVFQSEFKDVSRTTITDYGALRQQGDKKMASFILEITKNGQHGHDKRDLASEYLDASGSLESMADYAETVPADGSYIRNATFVLGAPYSLNGSTIANATISPQFTFNPNNSTYSSGQVNNPDPVIRNGNPTVVKPSPVIPAEKLPYYAPSVPGMVPQPSTSTPAVITVTNAIQMPSQTSSQSSIPLPVPATPGPAPENAGRYPKFTSADSGYKDDDGNPNGTFDWNVTYTGPVLMYWRPSEHE